MSKSEREPTDRDQIRAFALHLQSFVQRGLEIHGRADLPSDDQTNVPLSESSLPDLAGLWRLQSPRFDQLHQILNNPEVRVRVQLDLDQPADSAPWIWVSLDELLTQFGLAGAELETKTRLYYISAERHSQRPSPAKFGEALEAADITLGSLARLFTFLDPVKEAKEAIEWVFSSGRTWIRRLLGWDRKEGGRRPRRRRG